MDLLDELNSTVIPGDGAMGTLLMASGIPAGKCFEELCVSNPDLIAGIHEQYINAGARIIRTNSFGANAVRLEKHGLAKRVNEINWSAAQLAKQSARGKNVYVAGSVGPLGITGAQATAQGISRAKVFREQIGALLDGGCNLILLETFTDPEELAIALNEKQSLHHCLAICSMACRDDGRLFNGASAADALGKLRIQGADITGLNCMDAPTMLRLCRNIPSIQSAFPSAGLPIKGSDGSLHYELTPDDFAQSAIDLAKAGVHLIGGCCGTTPAHIAKMRDSLGNASDSPA